MAYEGLLEVPRRWLGYLELTILDERTDVRRLGPVGHLGVHRT